METKRHELDFDFMGKNYLIKLFLIKEGDTVYSYRVDQVNVCWQENFSEQESVDIDWESDPYLTLAVTDRVDSFIAFNYKTEATEIPPCLAGLN